MRYKNCVKCSKYIGWVGLYLWKIAQLLGHSSAKATELYAHSQPSWGQDAVAVLGSITKGPRYSQEDTPKFWPVGSKQPPSL